MKIMTLKIISGVNPYYIFQTTITLLLFIILPSIAYADWFADMQLGVSNNDNIGNAEESDDINIDENIYFKVLQNHIEQYNLFIEIKQNREVRRTLILQTSY